MSGAVAAPVAMVSSPPPAGSPDLAPTMLNDAFEAAAPVTAPEAATTAEAAAASEAAGKPAAAAASEIGTATDSVAASALAKLKAMKEKYNIQTTAAQLPSTAAPTDSAAVVYTNFAPAAPAAPSASASPMASKTEEKVVSPSLDVAALRKRLARLKKH